MSSLEHPRHAHIGTPYGFTGSDIPPPIPSASALVPAEGEITAPAGPPLHKGPLHRPEATILANDFDNSRIDWEWGERTAGHTDSIIGYDPKYPQYVIRPQNIIDGQYADSWAEQGLIDEKIGFAEAEIQRLTQGTGLLVPDYLHVTPRHYSKTPWKNPEYAQYLYVERLEGQRLNPEDPVHAAYALQLGSAATRYLAATAPGDIFTDEYIRPTQWTVGRPALNPHAAPGLYLHDVETVRQLNIRPPHNPHLYDFEEYFDTDPDAFNRSVERASAWIGVLPASPARDELLRTLDAVHDPPTSISNSPTQK